MGLQSIHRRYTRKFTKTKAAFTSEAVGRWKSILSKLLITFGERIQIDKLEN